MRFYVTLGQQYATHQHPFLANAHPDGYVVIDAEDANKARQIAFARLGSCWAFLYAEGDFDAAMYPRGPLLTLDGIVRCVVVKFEQGLPKAVIGKPFESVADATEYVEHNGSMLPGVSYAIAAVSFLPTAPAPREGAGVS